MYARTTVDAGKSDPKVLFLTGSIDHTILLKQVSSLCSFPESSAIVTFASKNEYRRLGNNNTKLYLLDSLDKFDLVLFDEFVMYKDMALDAVTTAAINSHIILVTSNIYKNHQIEHFQQFSLSGSLRATKELTEYVQQNNVAS